MFDLSVYAGKHICVAVSGGRDSMALIDFIFAHTGEYGFTLSALNCDHKIRGAASARDSAFVADWCVRRDIPLMRFVWEFEGAKTEQAARAWRRSCFSKALDGGADFVATAHHIGDNAETVLFNLARGSAVSGLTGISDDGRIIHPLINCTRMQIDAYVTEHGVPFVDDETNFTDEYTRNKIRHNVLPELEKAVPGAAGNIFRLSRLAAEDEGYFQRVIDRDGILKITAYGAEIKRCDPVVFKRAAVKAIKYFKRIDYTCEQLARLAELEKNKKFGFLGLTAYGGADKIVITEAEADVGEIKFFEYRGNDFYGSRLIISDNPEGALLKFDYDAIPETAVIRFKRDGDKFKKFGGGTKSLGDYFTDKKIPFWVRGRIPLIADGSEVLVVCGVEISDKVKIRENTEKTAYIVSRDYREE